jgi:predicted nucleic acid-binding protein
MTSRVALRTLDALHLSLAFRAAAASLATFDRRMGAAAATLGLTLFPGAPPA